MEEKEVTKNSWRGANNPLSQSEQREFTRLEKEIPELEAKKQSIEATFTSESLSTEQIQELSEALSEIIDSLEEKTNRWLELSIKSEM